MESVGMKEKTTFSFVVRNHQKIYKEWGNNNYAVVFCQTHWF